jgi:anti-anti-sigma regulatory factor
MAIPCDVNSLEANLSTVDVLARLQLLARRAGHEVRLQNASPELWALLSLVGLDEVLRVDPGRETEQREERVGLEEERELPDPAA